MAQKWNDIGEFGKSSKQKLIVNNVKYLFENGTLRILDSTHADVGAYICRATTGGGQTEATMFLSVLDLPTARVVPNLLYIGEGSSFSLSCIVGGVPTPEVSWYFKGNKITPDSKYYISHRSTQRLFIVNRTTLDDLSIRETTRSDIGIYECRATNPAGIKADYAHINLASNFSKFINKQFFWNLLINLLMCILFLT